MQLMQLADAPRFVSRKGDNQQQQKQQHGMNFTVVVQQISADKRAVVGRQKQRVSTHHVLHLADVSRSFFKMTCWGEAVPTLPLDDHAPEDIVLRVGGIVLFTNCQVKSFRGNIEAQFLRASSNVQLLYWKDRYFNTRGVRLKDLYSMIEWYKHHRHEFLFMASDSGDGSSTSYSSEGFTADLAHGSSMHTKIHDLRENMVANVVYRLRDLKPSESVAMGTNLVLPHGHTHTSRAIESTDSDCVLCREFVILSSSTRHRKIKTRDICKRLGAEKLIAPVLSTSPAVFGSFGELENSSSFDDLIVLDNLRIEQICVSQPVESATRVLPQFAQLLVESYCSVCDGILPELQLNAIPPLYGPCTRCCRMVVRDAYHQRLQLEVEPCAMLELVGNIEAEMLIYPHIDGQQPPFNVKRAMSALLNVLVDDASQMFRTEIRHDHIGARQPSETIRDNSVNISQNASQQQNAKIVFTLLSLMPSPTQHLTI